MHKIANALLVITGVAYLIIIIIIFGGYWV